MAGKYIGAAEVAMAAVTKGTWADGLIHTLTPLRDPGLSDDDLPAPPDVNSLAGKLPNTAVVSRMTSNAVTKNLGS